MNDIFTKFKKFFENNNAIKVVNVHLNKIIQSYNYYQISEKFQDIDHQDIKQNMIKSNIIIVDKYIETQYLVIGFSKTIIIIETKLLFHLNSFFSNNANLTICFLSDIKPIFDANINFTYKELKIDPIFKEELINFNFEFILKTNDKIINKFFNGIKSSISGFLIKQSYSKMSKNRMNNFFSKIKNTTSIEYIEDEQLIELRTIDAGSTFAAKLFYYIEKEEFVVIKIQKAENDENFKLKNREIENYSKIQHFLLPNFIGLTQKQKHPIIEFIKGCNLTTEINLNYSDKLTIIFQLMLIIEFLHRNNFIFRDLKPNNIMIDEFKTAVLIDFDRMISSDPFSNITAYSVEFGSIYSAPEIDEGYSNQKSDIFSLGQIIFYLMTSKNQKVSNFDKCFPILFEMYQKCVKKEIEERPSIKGLILEFYINYYSLMSYKNLFQLNETYFLDIFDKKTIDIIKNLENDPNNPLTIDGLGSIYEDGKYFQSNINKAIEYYQNAANKNIAHSQNRLGMIYLLGKNNKIDIQKAVKYFQYAAYQNYPSALNNLGIIYSKDSYGLKNIPEALNCFIKSANLGCTEAQYQLGIIYYQGLYVKRDINKSIYYYALAAEKNMILAQNNLGSIFYEGKFVPIDINKAIKYYKMAADQNHPTSQYNLGVIYYEGKYINQNINKALFYFQKAAEQKNVKSLFLLGVIYEEGKYVQRDILKSIYYYELAAKHNYPNAYCNLGAIYYDKRYGLRNLNKAISYFYLAAKLNNAESQFNLGVIYYKGIDVVSDIQKAIYYYKKASNQNYIKAHFNLGLIYYLKGDINLAIHYYQLGAKQNDAKSLYQLGCIYYLQQNFTKSIKYLTLAANKNDSYAQYNLGFLYAEGKHIQRNINKSLFYLRLSANQNNKYAQFTLGFICYKRPKYLRSIEKSVYYLSQSSHNGHIQASFTLGFFYQEGKYVKKDIKKAMHFYKIASSFNYEYAKNNLGIIYKIGYENDVHKNFDNAYIYFEEAINQKGDILSMYNLSHMYIYDIPNENNLNKAIELLFKSLIYEFLPSLELLCVALLLKHKWDISNIRIEIEKHENNDYCYDIINIIKKRNLSVKSNFEILFESIRNNVYIYNCFKNFIPHTFLNANYLLKNIDHIFYEGFGLDLNI